MLSGVLQFMIGMAIAIPGYLEFSHQQSSLAVDMMLEATGWRSPSNTSASVPGAQLQWASGYLAFFTYVFVTPGGFFAMYLGLTGWLRSVSAWVDDARGDLMLTMVDAIVFRSTTKRHVRKARETREALEGAEVADRVVTGAKAGIPDAELVVIASRGKPGWVQGAYIITSDKWYRLAAPIHRDTPNGLRTMYPMNEVRDLEVMRKGIPYELPSTPPRNLELP